MHILRRPPSPWRGMRCEAFAGTDCTPRIERRQSCLLYYAELLVVCSVEKCPNHFDITSDRRTTLVGWKKPCWSHVRQWIGRQTVTYRLPGRWKNLKSSCVRFDQGISCLHQVHLLLFYQIWCNIGAKWTRVSCRSDEHARCQTGAACIKW